MEPRNTEPIITRDMTGSPVQSDAATLRRVKIIFDSSLYDDNGSPWYDGVTTETALIWITSPVNWEEDSDDSRYLRFIKSPIREIWFELPLEARAVAYSEALSWNEEL